MAQLEGAHALILGNPENRRVRLFCEAMGRAGLEPARPIAYLDVLERPERLEEALRGAETLRIDSAGESVAVERRLLEWGAEVEGSWARVEPERVASRPPQRGQIYYPGQMFAGYRRLLERIAGALECVEGCRVMIPPDQIAAMFDKHETAQRLERAGVPHPERLGPVRSHEELREVLDAAGCCRAFLKPRWSSSASGVIAYMTNSSEEVAMTSAEIVERPGGRVDVFNSLRLRRYRGRREVARLVDELAAHGIVVERWISKRLVDSRRFDVRVVVIDGRARHVVGRASSTPLTNLHLGNERVSAERLRALLGDPIWGQLLARAEQAVAAFPGALYAGVDVMVADGGAEVFVLEVNAFGDLLPGLTHRGESTYEAEVATWWP